MAPFSAMLLAAVMAAPCSLRSATASTPAGVRKESLQVTGFGLSSSYAFDAYLPSTASNSTGGTVLPLVVMLSGFCLPADLQDSMQLRYTDLVVSRNFIYLPLRSAHIARTCALCSTTVKAANAMGNMPIYAATAQLLEVTSRAGSCTAWDATSACCVPERAGRDGGDVPLLKAVIEKVQSVMPVDTRRISIVGIANGGFMAMRAACELGNQLAGVVAYAAGLYREQCSMTNGLPPLLLMQGDADVVVPFGGASNVAGVPFPGFKESARIWSGMEGCTGAGPSQQFVAKGGNDNPLTVNTTQYTGCTSGLESWEILDGQHFALPDTSAVIFQKALTEFLLPKESATAAQF